VLKHKVDVLEISIKSLIICEVTAKVGLSAVDEDARTWNAKI